jgi:hypothetical protein
MLQTDIHEFDLELAIIKELAQVDACTFDELSERLPVIYSWDEVFSGVDRLRREGTITLQHSRSLKSILFLTPPRTIKARARHLRPV